jgi:hypothetical protein
MFQPPRRVFYRYTVVYPDGRVRVIELCGDTLMRKGTACNCTS